MVRGASAVARPARTSQPQLFIAHERGWRGRAPAARPAGRRSHRFPAAAVVVALRNKNPPTPLPRRAFGKRTASPPAEDAAPQIRRRSAGVPPAFRTRSAGVPHPFRTRSAPPFRTRSAPVPHPFRTRSARDPHRCRTGAAPVPHRCRRRSAADPHGYPQTARKAKNKVVFFPSFLVFLCFWGCFCVFWGGFCQKTPRRTSAGVPHAIRTVLRTCPALAPHLLRACAALVPHLCRTCAALVSHSALVPNLCRTCAALVPHLFRTCVEMLADLRRGVLCPPAPPRNQKENQAGHSPERASARWWRRARSSAAAPGRLDEPSGPRTHPRLRYVFVFV